VCVSVFVLKINSVLLQYVFKATVRTVDPSADVQKRHTHSVAQLLLFTLRH